MKITLRNNVTNLPYSLHDSAIIGLIISDNKLTMRLQSGFIVNSEPFSQVNGEVVFENVDWDFSYIYLISYKDVLCGNVGHFSGEKISLWDFITKKKQFNIDVVDETYGYNLSKFGGYIFLEGNTYECMMEIYHLGDMKYLENE